MPDNLQLLTEGFKLNVDQRGLLIRVGWVLMVSGHIAWACGLLAFVGFSSPFVRAENLAQVEQKLNGLDEIVRQSLAQSKAKDVRDQLSIICTKNGLERDKAQVEKERLQIEYYGLMGYRYIEPPCEQLR
jgi:hypothetical protein